VLSTAGDERNGGRRARNARDVGRGRATLRDAAAVAAPATGDQSGGARLHGRPDVPRPDRPEPAAARRLYVVARTLPDPGRPGAGRRVGGAEPGSRTHLPPART